MKKRYACTFCQQDHPPSVSCADFARAEVPRLLAIIERLRLELDVMREYALEAKK